MKKTLLILSCAIALTLAKAQDNMVVAPVSDVTIYQQGAFVTRSINLNLQTGLQKIVFTGLPLNLEQNKLFASADDDIKIISVSTVSSQIAKNILAIINKQEDSVSNIEQEIKLLAAYQTNYQREYALIEHNKTVNNKENGFVLELEKLANLYRTRLTEISKLMHNNALQMEKLKIQVEDIKQRISEQKRQALEKTSVELNIKSKSNKTSNIALKYFVQNTGWSTLYNFRFAGIDKPCLLDISANIYNYSGDDWNNVLLTLSTANPTRQLQPQAFSSWVINQLLEKRKNSYEINMALNTLSNRAMNSDNFSSGENNINENATEMTVTYALEDKITLEKNNKTATVELKSITTNPNFKHIVNLANCDDTYLTANITGWQKWRLTNGPVNIYNYGELNGTAQINTYQLNDTLQIPLGIDKNVIIKYKTLRDNREKIMLSSNYKHEFAYEITVKNNNTRPINLTMIDQVPISTNDKITIETNNLSGAEYESTTGKITWTLPLEAGKGAARNLEFTVKYPKEQQLNISGYQQRRL